MKWLKLFIIVMAVGGVLLAISASSRESKALQGDSLTSLPAPEAARRIESFANVELPSCYADLSGLDGLLTQAIVAVEYMEHSDLENLVEVVLVKGASVLNMKAPDLSLGPGQIRPSTVCHLLPQQQGCQGNIPSEEVFLSLLDQCKNIQLAYDLVASMRQRYQMHSAALDTESLDVDIINSIAREYNGQKNDGMENMLYRVLVTLIVANKLNHQTASNDNG